MVKKIYTSKLHPKIEAIMEHFRPRFGNDEDIHVLEQYTKIKKLLAELDTSELRRLQLKKLESQMTSKMKEVHMKEKNLYHSLKKMGYGNQNTPTSA